MCAYGREGFIQVVSFICNEDSKRNGKEFLKVIKEPILWNSFIIAEIKIFFEPVLDAIVNKKDGEWDKCYHLLAIV